MKYDVTFTEQAENAAGQLDRIEEKILSLGEYPEKFRQYEREPWKSRNTRVVPVDNYVIFYIPDKTKKLVTVIRVMYSGRKCKLGRNGEPIRDNCRNGGSG